ncbi:two-component regulator propeller domain-containing protein [Ohtaekwangia kribbensis]|uniref:histidine kinase n=1 Tax=Ohtaekwangia kribbensis TaxID=688913 RepID=A0ABW3K7A7_9BACT
MCCSLRSYTQPVVFTPVAPEAISNSFVRCFFKDSRGFMWFGLADGLIRYDGTNAYRYEHNPLDKASLCHNSINVIVEDDRQRLWIGTAFGLCIYDPEKDHFVNVDSLPSNKNHLNNSFITALSFDLKRRLWIGTHGGGVNIYDPEAHIFMYLHDPAVGKASSPRNYINSMLRVDDQMLCATKGGLKLFNTTKTISVPLTFAGEGLPIRQLTQLVPDKAGNIWVTSVNGEIFKLVPANGYYTVNQIFSGSQKFGASWNNIVALNIDRKGNLWISGEHAGLNYLNTTSGALTQYLAEEGNPTVLPTNSIRSVYIDDTGLTWIGTFDRGAYLIDSQAGKFNPVYSSATDLAGKRVKCFTEDHQGNVWLGIEGVGLARIDSRTRTLQKCTSINQRLTNKFLTALICDRNGNLWIGTGGHGVSKLNLNTQELTSYFLQSGGFGENKASCLYEDKRGIIWAGSAGSGLFYFDEIGKRFVVLSEQMKPNYITRTSYVSSVAEDSDGILWIGTMYGLYALTKEHDHAYIYQWFIQTEESGSLSSSAIQSLYEDHKKNLWIGTTDNGLNVKVSGEDKFKHYGKADGLASNTIRAILADASGNLWVSANTGLSKYDQHTRRFINYSRKDGLSSNDFYPSACLRSSTGQLFFGNNNGFNAFYPDSIRNTGGKPKVYLADIKINNQAVAIGVPGSPITRHISLTSDIALSYEQRSFIIDFAAIQFGPSARQNYAYKLEGFDTDWHYTGTNHQATYTNLDPGHYTFLAKASQSDGTWNEVPTQLEITIRQAPWKTAWAICLYIMLIAAMIFFAIKIRIDRVSMKNQLALERLAREQEHELSESKTQFFTNISHEFRTPLSLILMPLESLISSQQVSSSVKERVNTAYKNANKMMSLVNELMDFNKIESGSLKLNPRHGELIEFITSVASLFRDIADKRNITFSVRTQLTSLKGWFDRDKLERMLVNVLSNAFKFTADGGQITVIVNANFTSVSQTIPAARCLELVIVDNGIGMSSEELPRIFDKFYQAKSASKVTNPGTGIGLSLTRALVALHRGTITAESLPDKETKFIITLPIDCAVYDVVASEEMPEDVVGSPEESVTKSRHFAAVDAGSKDQYEVLVVEDNEELREYIAAELGQEFKVWQARNGQEGAHMAIEKTPDLIISDILMSQKSGIELCREMKSNIKTSHIPFILLTARATVEDQITGIESGADVYITKPFSVRFLLTHVRNLIESRQKLYSHFSQDVYLMPSKVTGNEIDQAFLQRAVDYIVEHIQDAQLGVDSIAELFSLSRVQVYRKIKALTGKTAVEFIRTVRLKQALKLMETKQYTLSEIAYLTGFNSASYFTRSFKDEYGKAPSEYLDIAS